MAQIVDLLLGATKTLETPLLLGSYKIGLLASPKYV
jgi:hypothetical protein